MRHIVTVLVENRAGVLSRIAGLFARRGFNIESLAVGITEDPRISRMTVAVDCDPQMLEQIEKQLNKLIDTIKVKILPDGGYIARELTLVRVNCPVGKRADVVRIAEIMEAKLVDISTATVTLEFADTTERTETFISLLKPFGIRELVRTGVSAIEK